MSDQYQLVRAGEAMTDLKLAVSDQWDKMVKLDANLTDGQSCPCRAAVESLLAREDKLERDYPNAPTSGWMWVESLRTALEHDCPKNMNVHAWQAIAEAVGELEQALEGLGQ